MALQEPVSLVFRGLLACLVPKGKRECQELALETQENKVQGDKKVTEVSQVSKVLLVPPEPQASLFPQS